MESAKFVREKLSKSQPWADFIVDEKYPGPNVSTLADMKSWVKSSIRSQSHTTGTCSMQPRAEGGVVDSVCGSSHLTFFLMFPWPRISKYTDFRMYES